MRDAILPPDVEVLPSAMRRDTAIVRREIALDDAAHELHRVLPLAHVDAEVGESVPPRLLEHDVASLADGADAAEVGGGVDARVGGARHGDLGLVFWDGGGWREGFHS